MQRLGGTDFIPQIHSMISISNDWSLEVSATLSLPYFLRNKSNKQKTSLKEVFAFQAHRSQVDGESL